MRESRRPDFPEAPLGFLLTNDSCFGGRRPLLCKSFANLETHRLAGGDSSPYAKGHGLYFHNSIYRSDRTSKNGQKMGAVYLSLGTHDSVIKNCKLEAPMMTPRVDADVGKPATFRNSCRWFRVQALRGRQAVREHPEWQLPSRQAASPRSTGARRHKQRHVRPIRAADGQKSIYDELSGNGRWATQGILFDVAKADVKGESTPTLKEIASALKEHPELKVEIQGHTDNVGTAAANLKLSEERANAVKAVLTSKYGVSEQRITAKGYGNTKPIGPNTTVEGRANIVAWSW